METYSVNFFKGAKWVGYEVFFSKEQAILEAKAAFANTTYTAVNVEAPTGKVVFVTKGRR